MESESRKYQFPSQRQEASIMTMLVILPLLLLQQTCAAMELYISPTQRSFRGSNVVLGCTFSVDEPSVESSYFIIKWYFKRKEIVTFNNEGLFLQPRMSFDDRAARAGDASLFISNVNIFDDGTYTCSVMYNMERKEKDTQLQIMASPEVTITNKIVTENKESTMSCTATEFYPPDIRITWLRDNQLLQNSELGEITLNDDRTFSVQSIVRFTPTDGDEDRIFSCRVQHASLPEPRREDFQLDIKKDINIGLIMGLIGGLLCCLIFLAVLVIFFKNKKERRRKPAAEPQTVPTENPESKEVVHLFPAEDPLHPSTQDEDNLIYQLEHPSPEEAVGEKASDDISHDAPSDSCLPPTEDLSVEESESFEMIDYSEVDHCP